MDSLAYKEGGTHWLGQLLDVAEVELEAAAMKAIEPAGTDWFV